MDAAESERSTLPHELPSFTSRSVRRRRTIAGLLACDTIVLLLTVFLATFVRFGDLGVVVTSESGITGPGYLELSLGVVAVLLVAMYFLRLYNPDHLGWGSGELTRIVQAMAIVVGGTVLVMYVVGMPYLSREWAVLVWVFGVALVSSDRLALRIARSWLMRHKTWLRRPTLIVGSNVEAAEVTRILLANPGSGLVPVGCLSSSLKDKLSFDYCAQTVRTLGSASDLSDVVVSRGIDTVVIIASAFDYEVLQRMIKELRDLPVTVHISSALTEVLSTRALIREVSGIPLISLKGLPVSPAMLRAKRMFDLVVGGTTILFGMPFWAFVATLIKITSPGPVLYKSGRVGVNGEPFEMYKFRSMVSDADEWLRDLRKVNEADGPLFKIRDDPRITPVGRWLRRFSIDECPQFINVMKGEMSLVGPRPPLPSETVHYTRRDWRRLEAPPGMTGLWQVSGRSNLTFREMVRLDVFYLDNWSVGLDVALLLRTIPAVLFARGAY